ncbi:MAG: YafY family transcriptional regulator [Oscillospiraceae bacterium]|nr:YafY family transcriptional regulator [Oscillospiraceae bacterium]
MKIDRMIGILSVLLQKDKCSASELADSFEVSPRTIYRDIEALSMAGIPVTAERGKNGGIYIMEGFALDKTLLSSDEMKAVIAGLRSLDSVCSTGKYGRLMNKLSVDSLNSGSIIIDLSMWDKASIAPKIEQISRAVEERKIISFTYYSPDRTEKRRIEPYRLIFQWSSWYVWGWCEKRQDYRMFKLSRITELAVTDTIFCERELPPYTCDKLRHAKGEVYARVSFDSSVKWRIIDEFGTELPEFSESGEIFLDFNWTDKISLFQYILTFGDNAEIISPENIRRDFSEYVMNIFRKYDTQLSD